MHGLEFGPTWNPGKQKGPREAALFGDPALNPSLSS